MIRPYDPADLDELLDVWYRASLQAHRFLSKEFLEAERREIGDGCLPAAETFVYELDGRVAGFVALIENEVGGIFVDPDHQGRGIGRALMNQSRASRPYLELSVFEDNAVGRRFYDAFGFEVIGRHVHEATGLPELLLRIEPDAE